MTFFKAIQDNKVVSVGSVFLKWNIKKNKFYICSVDDGEFVESYDEKHIYKDGWMKPAPKEAGEHENASIVIISQQEYEDLLEELNEGNVIEVVQESVIVDAPPLEDEPQPEKPMSISDMRQMIIKQQEQIDSLLQMLT